MVLDAELVVLGENGRPDFQKHQQRMNVKSVREIRDLASRFPATYYIFDILYLDGRNIKAMPFVYRRELLSEVISRGSADHLRKITIRLQKSMARHLG